MVMLCNPPCITHVPRAVANDILWAQAPCVSAFVYSLSARGGINIDRLSSLVSADFHNRTLALSRPRICGQRRLAEFRFVLISQPDR